MDANHSPPAQPERNHGSLNYDIESTDGTWRGAGAWQEQDPSSEALMRYDDDGPREPLLRRRTMNTTSQIAIVGANICPIESLDYEYALHTNRLLSVSPLRDWWLRWLILSTSRNLCVLIWRKCLILTVFPW
jgi:hypothetical protein